MGVNLVFQLLPVLSFHMLLVIFPSLLLRDALSYVIRVSLLSISLLYLVYLSLICLCLSVRLCHNQFPNVSLFVYYSNIYLICVCLSFIICLLSVYVRLSRLSLSFECVSIAVYHILSPYPSLSVHLSVSQCPPMY